MAFVVGVFEAADDGGGGADELGELALREAGGGAQVVNLTSDLGIGAFLLHKPGRSRLPLDIAAMQDFYGVGGGVDSGRPAAHNSPCLFRLRPRHKRLGGFWGKRNRWTAGLLATTPEVLDDGMHVVPMPCKQRFTSAANFLDDWVGHGWTSINSIGVQIVGGSKPWVRQTASILPRNVAFAKCRQFQVSR
jgi:hypothetical protein